MQHALSILTVSAERAENEAIRREQTASCCEREGDFDRAENYRAQATIDRRITDDCREAIAALGHMAEGDLYDVFDECLGRRPHLLLEVGYNRVVDWMVHIYDATGLGIKEAELIVSTQSTSRDEAMTEAARKLRERLGP